MAWNSGHLLVAYPASVSQDLSPFKYWDFSLILFHFPTFPTASEETDITQVPEVGSALLKANKGNAVHFSIKFGLDKKVLSH